MSLDTGGEYVSVAAKASPSVAVATAGLAGVSLETWVLIVTLVYTGLQLVLLIRRAIKGKA